LSLAGVFPLQSTLEVDVSLVGVFLTVHDADGRYVDGLSRQDFRVYEDGEPREIAAFDAGRDLPTSAGILVDTSGSSADTLESVRRGVLEFTRRLGSDDEFFVMSFGTEAGVVHDFGEPAGDLPAALDRLRPWGVSVFLDALDSGIRKLGGREQRRKALIVLTDGKDNGSKTIYRDVARAAESGMVLLYFLGMGSRSLVDTHTLDGLAGMTGGRVSLVSGAVSPADALMEIREDLSRQYYLAYYSPPRAGSHSIRVETSDASYTVRARDGYLVE
jgi:Ca-activated chloride channel family protein